MKKYFLVLMLLVTACSAPAAPQPTLDVAKIQTSVAESAIAKLTQDAPTSTPKPTNTPKPTSTPKPTLTNTPVPEPIILTGSGDSITDIQKWDGPAILKIKYVGGGNFMVRNYPSSGTDYYDLLVNKIGSYEGTKLIDIFDVEHTARFEIKASGQWEIQVLPFSSVRMEIIPATISGTSDDVILINSGADLIKVDASQASQNFIIHSFSTETGRDLVVNEIAPYTGTSILNSKTFLLVITTTGSWSLEITKK